MPYYITDSNPDCDGWAVEKEDGEVIGCHSSRQAAIDQMVAVSLAEEIEPGGERAAPGELAEGDFVRWRSSGGTARGRVEHIMTEGTLGVPGSDFALNASEEDPAALIRIYRPLRDGWEETETLVGHRFSTLTKIEPLAEPSAENGTAAGAEGAKNLRTNARMRRAAAEGLRLREEYGRGGTSVGAGTARRIVADNVDLDLAVKMRAYFARHAVDRSAPGFRRGSEGWPSNGFIAWQLWGGDAGWDWAKRQVAAAERRGERGTAPTEKGESMQVKSFPAEMQVKAATKNDGSPGEFTAVVSVFGNVDLAGDRILPGAFASSLKRYADSGRSIPIVWNHDWNAAESFIGKTISAEETPEGLVVKGQFFDTERAQQVRRLLAERVVSEFSFAYDVVDEQKAADGANELRELHILEAGPTLKGANPATRLIEAKAEAAAVAVEEESVTESERMLESIAEAHEMLDAMLERIRKVEPSKAEEPTEESVNAEAEGLPAETALALIELAEHEN